MPFRTTKNSIAILLMLSFVSTVLAQAQTERAAGRGGSERLATQANFTASAPRSARRGQHSAAQEDLSDTPANSTRRQPDSQRSSIVEGSEGSVSYSLNDLVLIASSVNPTLVKAVAEIEQAKGERVQAGLYPNPRMETNNPEIWAGQDSYVNFGFQQDLVTKGKLRIEKAAADQSVRRESAEFDLARAKLFTEVRSQFLQTLAAKHRVALAEYLVRVVKRSVTVAEQLREAGEGNLTDVLLLENDLQRAYYDLDNARTYLEGEYRQLAAVIGQPDMPISAIQGTLFGDPVELNEDEVRNFVANQSSLVEAMRAEITRSQMLLRRQEVEPYPDIRFGPSYQTGTQSNSGQFWLSVVFEIPVWDLNQGNIRKANAKVRGATAELDVVRNLMLKQVSEKFANYRAARQRAIRMQNTMLPNAQKSISLVRDGFSKGQFDVSRLLQAQRSLTEIAREHINASEAAWISAAEIAGMVQLEAFDVAPTLEEVEPKRAAPEPASNERP